MDNLLNIISDYLIILDERGNIKFCNDSFLLKLGYHKLNGFKLDQILNRNSLNSLNQIIKNISIKTQENNTSIEDRLCFIDRNSNDINLKCNISFTKYKNEKCVFILSKFNSETPFNKDDMEIILDSIPSKLCVKGVDNRCIYANEKYTNMLSTFKNEIIGTKISNYWSKKDCQKFIDIEERAKLEKKPVFKEEQLTLDGEDINVEIFKAPMFDKNDNFKYMITIINDITLRKNIEQEINKNNDRMLNLIYNKENNIDIDSIIDKFAKDIFHHLHVDSLSIYLYDKNNSCLNLKTVKGTLFDKIPCEIKSLKLTESDIANLSINRGLIDYSYTPKRTKQIYENANIKVNAVGTYHIVVNGEFMGILNVTYINNNYPKYNQDSFINDICMKLGLIIKNTTISNELKDEFNRRIEVEKGLKRVLDISVDMIAIISCDGNFEDLSPQWVTNLGWSYEELYSMNFMDIVHDDCKELIKNKIYNCAISKLDDYHSNTNRIIIQLRTKYNNFKWFEINFKYINDENKFITSLKDITKYKEEEEALKSLEKAIEIEEIKNEFFANMSHEFRTPLNIILGSIQLFEKIESQGKIIDNSGINLKNYIKSIKQNSYRLLKLVNNIIDMTKIDIGYYELNLGNYNIINVVEEITLSVAQYISHKGINLVFDTDSEYIIIACDPEKIERIMLNLLSNSIKYTNENGEIFVNIKTTKKNVLISVRDNGVGIPKENLSLIFERFIQGDDVLTRRCEGSGIGLSLCKSLVEMHGGKIYAESELNLGSKFTFELPIKIINNISDNNKNMINKCKVEKCDIEFSDIYSI